MVDFLKMRLEHRMRREEAASMVDFEEAPRELPTLSFGKHRGTPLTEIETSYLEWVQTADRITPDLLAAIKAELAGRTPKVAVQDRHKPPTGVPADTLMFARLLVDAGQHELNAAIDNHHIDGAAQLLRAYLDDIVLNTGTLPF